MVIKFSNEPIIATLKKAVEVAHNETKNLTTKNSLPSRKWDRINTEFETEFTTTDSQVYVIKRSCWSIILIHCQGTLYSIMRNSRLNELQKNFEENTKHYACCLTAYLNKDLPNSSETLFPELEDNLMQQKEKVARSILEKIEQDEINEYVLITFDEIHGQLEKIELKKLNALGTIVNHQVIFNNSVQLVEPLSDISQHNSKKPFSPTINSNGTIDAIVHLKPNIN